MESDIEKASYHASLASTYCLQAGLNILPTATISSLNDLAVKLSGISAALSRIVLDVDNEKSTLRNQ